MFHINLNCHKLELKSRKKKPYKAYERKSLKGKKLEALKQP
jgi:hypothetical protein